MSVSIIFLLILIPLILGIPIMIAIYVYRDAGKRGMNAVLWMLIALLTPSLLGLIIYLLVRNNYSDLRCPKCDTPIEESFVVCPTCRTKLRPTCPSCATPVQPSWQVCPHCGTPLEFTEDVATPVRKKDKTLGKILIAIIVIPILIILLLIIFAIPYSFNGMSGYSSSSVTALSMDEFMEDKNEAEQELFTDWFEAHSVPLYGQPYHIFVYEADTPEDFYKYQYLIYIPGASGYQDVSYDTETKGFFNKKDYLALDITCDETEDEQLIFIFNYEGTIRPPQDFLITYNGSEHEIDPDSSINEPFYDPFHKSIAE
ncbi:MAG: zinc ribbon domain-containing protein [Lachnospiraceae bacterium]|nr:zinc ribbon domain-containing protein [Lachnospiraceae bacterium]